MSAFWLVQHEEYKPGDAALAYWGPFATREEADADPLALDETIVAVEVPVARGPGPQFRGPDREQGDARDDRQRVVQVDEEYSGRPGEITVEPRESSGAVALYFDMGGMEFSDDQIEALGNQVRFEGTLALSTLTALDRQGTDELIAALQWARDVGNDEVRAPVREAVSPTGTGV